MSYNDFVLEAYSFFTTGATVKDEQSFAMWKLPMWGNQPINLVQHIDQLQSEIEDHSYETAIGGV